MRSDFHRYNLRLQTKNIPPIDEATFIQQIGDLDESISGSDTSDSDTDSENTRPNDILSSLLKKQAKISQQEQHEDNINDRRQGPGNIPRFWLSSPKLPQDTILGVYKAIFSEQEQSEAPVRLVDILRSKQIPPIRAKSSRSAQTNGKVSEDPHFFLCMIGGGHFAAAVIGLAPEVRTGPGGVEERHAVVKAHKTFHRYTTRRKQGGSQSANDNAKGNAHSVGSSIRRANEAALVQDVRNILAEWRQMIDSAELIFIRATGSQNRHTLFGPYENQVLTTKDKRIRGFPFSTKRATQNELIRAFQTLTRIHVSNIADVEEEKPKPEVQAKQQLKPKAPVPKATPEEEAALLHTSQIQNLIRRSKAPGLLLYLNKNTLSANFEFYPPNEGSNHHSPTPLHLAASTNASAIVTALLTKAHADPALTNADGKTPYDIAGDAKTRDAFRVARYQLGDTGYNWSAAHVGSAISAAEAETRANREQEELEAAESERRKADLEQIRKEEEQRTVNKIERKAGQGKNLGGAVPEKTWTDQREEENRGLTPEMRQRLERERRARAAEARISAMQGGRT